MTSTEFVESIITQRGQHTIPEGVAYWEGHHILPACKGGQGKLRSKHTNIIWLTPQEHYEVHRLLALENPTDCALQRAWYMMSHRNGVEVSAEEYAKAKEAFVWAISGNNSPSKREEVRQHFREGAALRDPKTHKGVRRFGKDNPNYGHHKLAKENHFYWGQHRSEEVRDRISQTRRARGIGIGDRNPRARAVQCVETGEIFNTLKKAAQRFNLKSNSSICQCCRGLKQTAGGMHWRYVEEG